MAASDAIVVLCKGFITSLPTFLQRRTVVIPNFPYLANKSNSLISQTHRKRILTVARLYEPEKQLSILLHAFASLKDNFPGWECHICGEGPHRNYYETLITDLGVNNRITLPGAMEDISAEYAEADLFTLPSRYEGFPLALAEAQGFGLPAVGFAACPGVNEIIVHGENGLLAPEMTAESLAKQLRTLMTDEQLRQRMGTRARELSARYDRDRVLDQWEVLFRRVVNRKKTTDLDSIASIEDPDIRGTLRTLVTNPLDTKDNTESKRVLNMLRSSVKHHINLHMSRLSLSKKEFSKK
ncbi:glycosyltransferase [Desulfovibrio sp. ZJ200]|uniref:glycosyltransferase n=1 Tax=Desulfovibrio sp. ZJ200 TaxID=2709792 RepID=UPI0013E9B613|nr:glycosyltransferase [Desulfovibrio sp. ZJ200]